MFMMGELVHNDINAIKGCQWNPKAVEFAQPIGARTTNSQIVLTENAVQCSLDNLMRSPIGRMRFSTERLNKMFEMFEIKDKFVMDTTTVGEFLPIFPKKLGKGKALNMILSFKHFDVKFG